MKLFDLYAEEKNSKNFFRYRINQCKLSEKCRRAKYQSVKKARQTANERISLNRPAQRNEQKTYQKEMARD